MPLANENEQSLLKIASGQSSHQRTLFEYSISRRTKQLPSWFTAAQEWGEQGRSWPCTSCGTTTTTRRHNSSFSSSGKILGVFKIGVILAKIAAVVEVVVVLGLVQDVERLLQPAGTILIHLHLL